MVRRDFNLSHTLQPLAHGVRGRSDHRSSILAVWIPVIIPSNFITMLVTGRLSLAWLDLT